MDHPKTTCLSSIKIVVTKYNTLIHISIGYFCRKPPMKKYNKIFFTIFHKKIIHVQEIFSAGFFFKFCPVVDIIMNLQSTQKMKTLKGAIHEV